MAVEENDVARPRWLFATGNPHKLEEVTPILGALGIDVFGLHQLEALGVASPRALIEPTEDASSFVGNARIKARSYAAQTGHWCMAEDSGLEVDALDGAPGVYSARYAGAEGSRAARDRANNERLLAAMAEVPPGQRAARFVAVMVVARPDGEVIAESRGTFEGQVATAPRGTHGFGYDPLLWLPDEGRTSAELTPAEKNERSHRGQAVRALAAKLADVGLK
ncbi:MAG: RdgB/HAM1 family non-canonical purine NTP pyrophosphatase [Myxococcota bacterium]